MPESQDTNQDDKYPSSSVSREYRSRLLTQINERFNLEGFRTLCFDLDVDYDNLGGESKEAKIRELILKFQQEDRILVLIQELQKSRKNQKWEVPPKQHMRSTASSLNICNDPSILSQVEITIHKWLRKNLFFSLAKELYLPSGSVRIENCLVFIQLKTTASGSGTKKRFYR
jgi:Effector-associated domain 7